MAKRVTAYITGLVGDEGPAFATRADNDERVYIPAALRKHMEPGDMDEVELVIVKNKNEGTPTPWFAIRGVVIDEEDAA